MSVKVSKCERQVLRSLVKRGKKKGQKATLLELRPVEVASAVDPQVQHPASWASVYLKRLAQKGLVDNVGTNRRGVYRLSAAGKKVLSAKKKAKKS